MYLKIESQFPSGHYTRSLLENRTKKVQLQRWFQVETKDKAYGWIAEDHLLNALKLALQAKVLETAPIRDERSIESRTKTVVLKGSVVSLLAVKGSWAEVELAKNENTVVRGWLPTQNLEALIAPANSSLSKQRIFIPKLTILFTQPTHQGKVIGHIPPATFATIVRALPPLDPKGWLEVRIPNGDSGYVHRDEVITAADLGKNGARVLKELASLRSAPLPYAHLARNIPNGLPLKIIKSERLRWGQARLSGTGEVWWPITDEGSDVDRELILQEKLSTDDLFRRKIFDMASSPAIPSLKFVSAQGVYRTIDGKEWVKIPMFQDKNFPIAVAGLGSIFVGPFVSDDHGETFQQWIRWDTLVASMKRLYHVSPKQLRIQEIRPEDPAGRRVVLKLSVGTAMMIKVVTDDQGRSWRPL